jgi:hypothetical protein
VWRELERIRVGARDVAELDVLTRLRSVDLGWPQQVRDEAERLLGAEGASLPERLGAPEGAAPGELRGLLVDAVSRWRARAEDPLARRFTTDTADAVVRICEALLTDLADAPDGAGGGRGSAPRAAQPGPR